MDEWMNEWMQIDVGMHIHRKKFVYRRKSINNVSWFDLPRQPDIAHSFDHSMLIFKLMECSYWKKSNSVSSTTKNCIIYTVLHWSNPFIALTPLFASWAKFDFFLLTSLLIRIYNIMPWAKRSKQDQILSSKSIN